MKRKLSEVNSFASYTSGTELNSIVLNDPFVKYMDLHHETFLKNNPQYSETIKKCLTNKNTFTDFIMKKGNEFENCVVLYLKKIFFGNFVDIGAVHGDSLDYDLYIQKFDETVDALHKSVGVIFSGVLIDHEERLYGVPDVIIRGDFLKTLHEDLSGIDNPSLRSDLYYILDIKFTTLKISADGVHITNEGMNSCYKVQTFIYNKMLNFILSQNSQKTFLLGRGFKYTSKGIEYKSNNILDKIATIDFETYDKNTKNIFTNCLKILNGMKGTSGKDVCVFSPPNMKNEYDYPWTLLKKEVAIANKELTLLWNVSPKNRDEALSKGITSIDVCSINDLGINGVATKKILKEILEINSKNSREIFRGKLSLFTANASKKCSVFLDFESINNVILEDFSQLPKSNKNGYVFQIGAYIVEPIKESEGGSEPLSEVYLPFVVNSLGDDTEEYNMCCQFYSMMKDLINTYKNSFQIFCYSPTEITLWNKLADKYDVEEWLDLNKYFIDLLKVFKDNLIVFKGAYDYNLKNIVNALYDNGLLKNSYKNGLSSGNDVMLMALEAKFFGVGANFKDRIQEIIDYNEIDCKSMYEIIKILNN